MCAYLGFLLGVRVNKKPYSLSTLQPWSRFGLRRLVFGGEILAILSNTCPKKATLNGYGSSFRVNSFYATSRGCHAVVGKLSPSCCCCGSHRRSDELHDSPGGIQICCSCASSAAGRARVVAHRPMEADN